MRPAFGTSSAVPSTSLLRYLKNQSEAVCFFTSNSVIPCCRSAPVRRSRPSSGNIANSLPSSSRHLTTTSKCHANVESSYPRFDQLAFPHGRRNRPNHFASTSANPAPFHGLSEIQKSHRLSSTNTKPLLKRLWKQKSNKPRSESQNPTDLPPLPSFLDDVGGASIGRSKTGKSGSELKLRCTELDENGNVTTVNGEFKKSELIAKVLIENAMAPITSHDS